MRKFSLHRKSHFFSISNKITSISRIVEIKKKENETTIWELFFKSHFYPKSLSFPGFVGSRGVL